MELYENIKKYRKKSNLDQSELAKLLGVSVGTISNYERGLTVPSTETLLKISKILGINIEQLLNEIDINLMELTNKVDTFTNYLIENTVNEAIEWDSYADYIGLLENGFSKTVDLSLERIFKIFDNLNKHSLFFYVLPDTQTCIFTFSIGIETIEYFLVLTHLNGLEIRNNEISIRVYQSIYLEKLYRAIKSVNRPDLIYLNAVMNEIKTK